MKNVQALQIIQQEVERGAFHKVMITYLAKATWETLASSYKHMAKVNIVKLENTRRYFESFHMKET